MNIELGEIPFYKYRCEGYGNVHKSTGKAHSIRPDCKSDNVVKI
jgi:hypothetical protein